jgi:hypothetical protein
LWQRLGSFARKKDQDGEGGRWAEARARFWTELREGQREAEAHKLHR